MNQQALTSLPVPILAANTWLIWRLVQSATRSKPLKLPYYATNGFARGRPHGEGDNKLRVPQGHPDDIANLVPFSVAVETVRRNPAFSGVGLAMVASNGLVALDFDDCINDLGQINDEVVAICHGTYSEISPSGKGVRAFFTCAPGAVRDRKPSDADRKSKRWPYHVEFFHSTGYVTVTGNVTPDCQFWGHQHTVAPLSERAAALYRQRFENEQSSSSPTALVDNFFSDAASPHSSTSPLAGVAGAAVGITLGGGSPDDDWHVGVAAKVGLTIEKARAFVNALDPDGGYDDWLKAGQSLHHEFSGSEAALQVWQEWSRKSAEKYPGDRALVQKWESFGRYQGPPITAAWLLKHSKVARVSARYDAVASWKERIAVAADDYDLKEKVCPGIAGDSRLGEIEREELAQALVERFKKVGVKLTIVAVRKLITPFEVKAPTVTQQRPLTEFGMAERMLDKYGHELMYVPELDTWFGWTGVYWKRANEVEVEHLAKETVRSLIEEAEAHQHSADFYAFCAIAQQARMVRNMVTLAASDPRVAVPAVELDKDPYLLGVMNGVVDLRTGNLMPPDQKRRMTRVCSCNYVPDAKAPLWEKVILDVFSNDADMAAFFQRLIGYTAIGNPTEDVMVIAHGNGSNGKSTLFGTVRKVFGGYSKSADAVTFLSDTKGGQGGGGAREDLLRLQGSRMCYVNEPDEGGELREGMVKTMTGGDAITARGVYGKASVEFEPTWCVFMPTNHRPIIKGSDYGIWRRILLLPFNRNFDNDPAIKKDDKLGEKLRTEAEGVLAWIVSGAGAYLRFGLKPPAAVRAARDQYRDQMDILSEWISDCCVTGPGYRETIKRLWQSWESYARERGELTYVRSSIALGRRLDQRFPSKSDGSARYRIGIAVRGDQAIRDDFFAESDDKAGVDGGDFALAEKTDCATAESVATHCATAELNRQDSFFNRDDSAGWFFQS